MALTWNTTGLTDNQTFSFSNANVINHELYESDRHFQKTLLQVVLVSYIPTCVVGVIGNGLVIFIVAYNAQLRLKAYNFYIWNLAFADLFFTLTLPFFCYATFSGNWLFGNFVCKLAHVLHETNKYASVFTLAALTVDRYLASYYDLDQFRTRMVGITVCIFVWILCSSIGIPYWMYAQVVPTVENGSIYHCTTQWPGDQIGFFVTFMALFQLLVGLVIPFSIIIISYVLLAIRLNKILKQSSTSRVARPSKKMTITVLVVVLTFLLCQTPYSAVEIISWIRFEQITKYGQMPTRQEKRDFVILNTVAQILVFVSCCCNPIIYGFTNNDYRKLYGDLLCRRRNNGASQTSRRQLSNTKGDLSQEGKKPNRFRQLFRMNTEDNVGQSSLEYKTPMLPPQAESTVTQTVSSECCE